MPPIRWVVFGAVAFVHGVAACIGARAQETDHGIERLARSFIDAQLERSLKSMNFPFEPFRIIGNIHYVGASDVSSFLITTPDGHILIDTGFEATVSTIRDGVRKLGYRFDDIKILLNSHAHLDHAGGHALVKRLTHAQVVMSQADSALLARGGKGDFPPISERIMAYKSAQADRIIRDGDQVSLGGVTLTAHLTPGHTKGCTTWTMVVKEGGQQFNVVFYGSTTILPGVHLVDNAKYPGIADDFTKTFRLLKSLPCDVFLAPHGSMFGLSQKARRQATGEKPNPFIDRDGYRSFVTRSEQNFQQQLEREQRGASTRSKLAPPK
jgi:metallo-beta-lactamase class B